ncbi:MAG: UDP-glucose/GDP-mannose dehydrogenase family protein [Acidimicrobiia bacterium]|nr:UDP-glucose/GDP-mannose dehydrogenase family protein [Acidimicrobiia bacterium]
MDERIAVIGAGYVGLTTAACLAELGYLVTCADVDAVRVGELRSGRLPIHEDGLGELVQTHLADGRLEFEVGAVHAVVDADVVFICVPTPELPDGSADMSFVHSVATEIGPRLKSGAIVINKSTVPVGSLRQVERSLARSDVAVVSNPEFLREGSAVADFLQPDRIVIGADDPEIAARVAALYRPLAAPILLTDPVSAETIKYAANSFLATKLSFVNALAAVCEAVGADVDEVMLGIGYDSRIGHEFLRPGPGWGGSCFPKDTGALIRIAEAAGYDFSLLRGVVDVNREQFERVVDKITRALGGSLDGARIAALGLAFKAGTDDVRHSPALEVIDRLVARGATVRAYDPVVTVSPSADVVLADDLYAACVDADVVVVLTEWDEFRLVDLDRLAGVVARRAVVDTRNVFDRAALQRLDFTFDGVGRR